MQDNQNQNIGKPGRTPSSSRVDDGALAPGSMQPPHDNDALFRDFFQKNTSVMLLVEPDSGEIIVANAAAATFYGYPLEHLVGMSSAEINALPPARIASERRRALHEERNSFQFTHRLASGEIREVEVHATPIRRNGCPLLFVIVHDISGRHRHDERLRLAASVFTHAREAIVILDAGGRIIDVNEAFSQITGFGHDEVLGRSLDFLGADAEAPQVDGAMWQHLRHKGRWYGEIWNRRRDGEVYAALLTIGAVADEQGRPRHYVALFSDITAQKQHQRQLEHIAHYDALTGLPNRLLLSDRLHNAMAQAQRRSQRLAVVYLDLDGFKAVNDTHGHRIGDQLLMAVAKRMQRTLREGDTIARIGGDEFVAVLVDLPDVRASEPALSRLLEAAAQPILVAGLVLQVSASLGVTFFPQSEEIDADQLLRQADQAMYQAKLGGKNRFRHFDIAHDFSLRGHQQSLAHVRRALDNGEMVLYYQPRVNMRSGQVLGAEALIRWRHPTRGLLAPASFLPVIQGHTLSVELGEWVIDTALSQLKRWQAMGLDIAVSVNVDAYHLQQGDFLERLESLLGRHGGVQPGCLELEMLETSALADLSHTAGLMQACRSLGVSFSLDDFGTGYSSLTYLKGLPAEVLKIDQSFVRDMLEDPDDLAILEGVLGLATAFRRQVVAEGVRSRAHGQMLLRLGCELAQGYAIAQPMPAAGLRNWVGYWQPDPDWQRQPPVSRDQLPLLFASVEHQAWLRTVMAFLRGEQPDPPVMDHRQCRFGGWLEQVAQRRHGVGRGLRSAESLHRRLHEMALELIDLKTLGRGEEALQRVGELQRQCDTLAAQLNQLMA